MRAAVAIVLLVGYPVSVHVGILSANPNLLAVGLACLLLSLTTPLWMPRWPGWLLAAAVFVGLLAGARALPLQAIAYAPPVLLNLFGAMLFAATLLPGRTPLITQIVQRMHVAAGDTAPMAKDVRRYSTGVTVVWALLFLALAALSAVLAVTGPQTLWSWVTNGFNLAAIAVLFVAEYALRHLRFGPRLPYRNFAGFLRLMARAGWRPQSA